VTVAVVAFLEAACRVACRRTAVGVPDRAEGLHLQAGFVLRCAHAGLSRTKVCRVCHHLLCSLFVKLPA
jgi:hypothetical protein